MRSAPRSTIPDLIVACVIGDGEAETGPLATAWHSTKFLNPVSDGAVLPILHLNGYKISNPTVLPASSTRSWTSSCAAAAGTRTTSKATTPTTMHELMATVLDEVIERSTIQRQARTDGETTRPRWPMIVLRSPKGWTGPKVVDGVQIEGTFRAHQVPLLVDERPSRPCRALDSWMRSYKPDGAVRSDGRPAARLAALAPAGRRGGWAPTRTPTAGCCCATCGCPTTATHAVAVASPGAVEAEDTRVLGAFLRDVITLQRRRTRNFRIFGPDETLSNMLGAVFEVTDRQWEARTVDGDEFLAPRGPGAGFDAQRAPVRGWLEGYLLTGRHGLFNCYEAFIHIVDSMFNQHAKWLKVTAQLPWRATSPR